MLNTSLIGTESRGSLLAAAASLPKGVKLDIWENESTVQTYSRAAALPAHTAILFWPSGSPTESVEAPRDVLSRLSQVASAPIFVDHDVYVGAGAVGGFVVSADKEGELIGRIAAGQIDPAANPHLAEDLGAYLFDEGQLRRWRIPLSRLPEPYRLINRQGSVWDRYRWQISSAAAGLMLEAALIAGLLRALRQREIATRALREERDGLERRVQERTRELEALANTDALTGVANRRRFLEVAEESVAQSRASGRPLSLLMLDIDHFKSINDNYGHACGDQVIRTVAQAVRSRLRPTDCIGRIGGEEFAVILPGADAIAAGRTAERILTEVRAIEIEQAAKRIRLTLSVGAAEVLGADDDLDDLMSRADSALYRAKSAGRNQVCIAA
jgi:diguanylate cyclase (GGDEF)-like protein